MPPATSAKDDNSPLIDTFNNPATIAQKSEKINNSMDTSEDASLQPSVLVATGLNVMKKQKIKTIFPHTAGANNPLLSFAQGDGIMPVSAGSMGSTMAPKRRAGSRHHIQRCQKEM